MINPLELTKRQILIISGITVALGIAFIAGMVVYVGATAKQATQQTNAATAQPATNKTVQVPSTQIEAPQATQNAPQVQQPQAQQSAPVQQEGGHIPFTSQPVTPGNPESYVNTVGQCPFYEMAGEKGCMPPAGITCNADWSICTYVGL